jgi:hypothetical protein
MKTFWKNKPVLFKVILTLEIVFLVLLFAISVRKRKEYTINADEFLVVGDINSTQEQELMNYKRILGEGAYEVTVNYTADTSGSSDLDAEVSAGYVRFTGTDRALKGDDIEMMYAGYNTASTRLWVRTGAIGNEITISIGTYGVGTLTVESLSIRESLVYRVVRFLGFLLLFVLLDIVYLFFFVDSEPEISTEKKKIIVGITVSTVFASMFCFMNYLYDGHDIAYHLQRIIQLAYALRDGNIPQRIEFTALNGYGYASSLFYGESLLLLPAVLYNCFVPIQTCYLIYVFFINLGTAIISFWCFYKMSGKCNYSLIATFAYTCSAYRLINIWLRSAVGEYSAMMFFPLIVYGLWYIYTSDDDRRFTLRELLPLIIGLTGVVQTHILSCEMLAEFIVLFVLLHFRKTFKLKRFVGLLKSVVITLLLNLWFVIPFLQSMSMNTVVNSRGANYIQRTGAYLLQLFSLIHTGDGWLVYDSMVGSMPVSVGAMLTLAVALFVLCCIKKKDWQLLEENRFKEARLYAGLGLLAVVISSYYFPWDFIQGFSSGLAKLFGMVQFSWRFMGIGVCLLSFMLLRLLEIMGEKLSKSLFQTIVVVMLAVAALSEGYSMTQFADNVDTRITYTDNSLPEVWVAVGEYMLYGSNENLIMDTKVSADEDVIIAKYENNGNTRYVDCSISGAGEHKITFPMWAYDNYHAYAYDGTEIETEIGADKRLVVKVDGEFTGRITVEYREPVVWKFANWISFFTFAVLVVYFVYKSKKTARTQRM